MHLCRRIYSCKDRIIGDVLSIQLLAVIANTHPLRSVHKHTHREAYKMIEIQYTDEVSSV